MWASARAMSPGSMSSGDASSGLTRRPDSVWMYGPGSSMQPMLVHSYDGSWRLDSGVNPARVSVYSTVNHRSDPRMHAPHAASAADAPARPWAPLVLLAVAQFMVVLDITVVNVALPSIGADLDIAGSDLQ